MAAKKDVSNEKSFLIPENVRFVAEDAMDTVGTVVSAVGDVASMIEIGTTAILDRIPIDEEGIVRVARKKHVMKTARRATFE